MVSVCMPTYRGAAYVAAAVDSVLAQTFENFELIVIDDCSPDETAEVVGRYRDPRLRFARNERNLGAQDNWNRCLRMARGRYFKLLPQDDLLAPECLARQVAVLEADAREELALVFCARTIIDERTRVLLRRGRRGDGGHIAARRLMRSCIRRGTNLIGEPGAVLVRTALLRQVGGFNGRLPYVIDLDCWFRLLLHGDAYFLPETLASFRVSRGSWSVALARRQGAEFREFIARVASRPELRIGSSELRIGKLMASLNATLRAIVYRALLH
jgi:glycosyltransferase involved in cell wall biosynthesis